MAKQESSKADRPDKQNPDNAVDELSLDNATLPENPDKYKSTLKPEELTPLFTEEEKEAWKKEFAKIEAEHKGKRDSWDEYYAARDAKKHALAVEVNSRVFERAEDLVDGLLFVVGHRAAKYCGFDSLFKYANDPKLIAALEKTNTPENRRDLHTILKAFQEIPKSWALSAFLRFLRNQGKQKDPKYAYHGKGMFAKEYGWKGDEIKGVCSFLMGYHDTYHYSFGSYQGVVNTFADVEAEIYRDDPDGCGAPFGATRAVRNEPLLEKMISILEERGLGSIPTPKKTGPKKKRVPKKFKPGDIIRKGNLRDLPLPALVKVKVEMQSHDAEWKDPWKTVEVEWVVTQLTNWGKFQCYFAGRKTEDPKDRTAAISPSWSHGLEEKEYLYGATYLGPYEGKLNPKKEAKVKFRYRRPGRGW